MLSLSILAALAAAVPQTTEELRAEILRACQATMDQGSFHALSAGEWTDRRAGDTAPHAHRIQGDVAWPQGAYAQSQDGDLAAVEEIDRLPQGTLIHQEGQVPGCVLGFVGRLERLLPGLSWLVGRAGMIECAGVVLVDGISCRTYRVMLGESDAAVALEESDTEIPGRMGVVSGVLEIRVEEESGWIRVVHWDLALSRRGESAPTDPEPPPPTVSMTGTVTLSRRGELQVDIPRAREDSTLIDEILAAQQATREQGPCVFRVTLEMANATELMTSWQHGPGRVLEGVWEPGGLARFRMRVTSGEDRAPVTDHEVLYAGERLWARGGDMWYPFPNDDLLPVMRDVLRGGSPLTREILEAASTVSLSGRQEFDGASCLLYQAEFPPGRMPSLVLPGELEVVEHFRRPPFECRASLHVLVGEEDHLVRQIEYEIVGALAFAERSTDLTRATVQVAFQRHGEARVEINAATAQPGADWEEER